MGLFNSGLGRRLMLQLLLGRGNQQEPTGVGRAITGIPGINALRNFDLRDFLNPQGPVRNTGGDFGVNNAPQQNVVQLGQGPQNFPSEFAPRQGGMPDFSGLPDTAGLLNSRPNTFPRGVPRKGQLFGQEPQPVQQGRDPGLFRERLSF